MSGVAMGAAGCSAGGDVIDVQAGNYSDQTIDPGVAECIITFNTDGFVNVTGVPGPNGNLYKWLNNPGNRSLYEIRVTPTTGTFSTGTTGSWLSLTFSRAWSVDKSGVGVKQCTATYEIRRAADLVVLDSASIQLSAQVDL